MTLNSHILTLVFFVCSSLNFSIASVPDSSRQTINVGIAGGAPFVFSNSNSGIAIDIWDKIVAKQSLSCKYSSFNNVEDALQALKNGNIDIAIGPISITAERYKTQAFSQPFYHAGISILSHIEAQSFWQKIKPFFSFKLLIAIGVFLMILALVGLLLWLAERNESPDQFSKDPIRGIGTGMWLAIVTMSTTGYGDTAPVTLMGRIIAGTWMVISIISATTMVAGIASTLTMANVEAKTITNIEQLKGKKTATVLGTSSETFLKKSNIDFITVSELDQAVKKLENKEVQAVVFDRPQLLFYLKEHKNDKLYISKAEYNKQGYGFAFSANDSFTQSINQNLLELAENQTIERIVHTYISKDE